MSAVSSCMWRRLYVLTACVWPLRTWEWTQFYSLTPQWSKVGCWQGPVGVSSVMTWQLSLKNWSRGMPAESYVCICACVRACVCVCVYMYFASHESIFPKSEHILQWLCCCISQSADMFATVQLCCSCLWPHKMQPGFASCILWCHKCIACQFLRVQSPLCTWQLSINFWSFMSWP